MTIIVGNLNRIKYVTFFNDTLRIWTHLKNQECSQIRNGSNIRPVHHPDRQYQELGGSLVGYLVTGTENIPHCFHNTRLQ